MTPDYLEKISICRFLLPEPAPAVVKELVDEIKRLNVENEAKIGTTCSRSFLEMRWYDKQWDKWTEWEEVVGFKLREKYGTTPEEWKASCKMWIEVGGHYEYRIGTRTDVTEWEISYRENERGSINHDHAQ